MFKERYFKLREELLKDKKVNEQNRKIIEKFLNFEEKKLKNKQELIEVDERSSKTLYAYIGRIKRLNKWFKNKSWKKLTKKEIEKLIQDLNDGKIKTIHGSRIIDRSLYYQMLRGRFFFYAGKNKIAEDYLTENSLVGRSVPGEVQYIEEETFRKIVDATIQIPQKLLLWLAFDVGENIGSLLLLQKKDFIEQINEYSKEINYLVILSKEKLKRSRKPRSELTNFLETAKYLKIVLKDLKPNEKLFNFQKKSAQQFLNRAVKITDAKCIPGGDKPTWKILRSSMACDLLKKDWSRDEVNARLGHLPSSRTIDRYINQLSLNTKVPQKKIYESNLQKIEVELNKSKDLNKLQEMRILSLNQKMDNIQEGVKELIKEEVSNLQKKYLKPKSKIKDFKEIPNQSGRFRVMSKK